MQPILPPANGFEFRLTRLQWCRPEVLELVLDDPSSSANVMTAQLQTELEQRLDQMLGLSVPIRGLLVSTAKPRIFIAGADIKYIAQTGDFSRQQVIEFCERGLRLYQRFAELPFPTVALIQGACLGGGLEFALALDWRIAAAESTTLIGLPEVHLGLIPGWAATVRVPRISCVETAMRRIALGTNFSAEEALRIRLVDRLVPVAELHAAGLEQLADPTPWVATRRQQMLGPAIRLRESELELGLDAVLQGLDGGANGLEGLPHALEEAEGADRLQAGWRESDLRESDLCESDLRDMAASIEAEIRRDHPALHPTAPRLVLDVITRSANLDFFAACAVESQAMAEVYTSATGQALVQAFLLNDRAKKSPGLGVAPEPRPEMQRVGIVGLGLMGQSVAELLARGPWELVLYDRDPSLGPALQQRLPTDRCQVASSWSDLRQCDVVLENVFEQRQVKREVLGQLEQVVSPQAHLLTNTSVIPIAELTQGLRSPERFCGLHFFNPIKETRLAEVAVHPATAPATSWVAATLAKQAKKMVIVVGDGPGLVVNRLLMALLNEAQRLLAEGCGIEEIDRAATDFGWRLGPFQIMDVIGLRTVLDAGTQIAPYLPDVLDAPPFVVPLIKAGRLGRQTAAGFYRYTEAGQAESDAGVEALLQAYVRPKATRSSIDPTRAAGEANDLQQQEGSSSETMALRLVAAMVVQAVQILERGQVRDAADVDLCCLLALGFPPHRGGLLYWADHYPLGRLLEAVEDEKLRQQLVEVCPIGARFYPIERR